MPLERRITPNADASETEPRDDSLEGSDVLQPLFETSEYDSPNLIIDAHLQSFRHAWIAELNDKTKKSKDTAVSSSSSICASKNTSDQKDKNHEAWIVQKTFPEDFPRDVFGRSRKLVDGGSNDMLSSDLIKTLRRKINNRGSFIELKDPNETSLTIVDIPFEILSIIPKYVVGSELNVRSLGKLSLVCAGFYLLTRDQELWYLICKRLFRASSLSFSKDINWRQMYLTVPHPHFHGVYIGKCSYVRHGEASFQDQFYRPWHMVVYYRHLRFFADGTVLMLTSSDHPAQTVAHLKSKSTRSSGILFGCYTFLNDNGLSLKMCRECEPSEEARTLRTHKKSTKTVVVPHGVAKQEFEIEFCFGDGKKRSPHCVLHWSKYDCHITYLNGETSTSSLDIVDKKHFPPLYFCRVRSFECSDDWDECLE